MRHVTSNLLALEYSGERANPLRTLSAYFPNFLFQIELIKRAFKIWLLIPIEKWNFSNFSALLPSLWAFPLLLQLRSWVPPQISGGDVSAAGRIDPLGWYHAASSGPA